MKALRALKWVVAVAVTIQGTVGAHTGPVDMRGGHSYPGGVGYHLHASAMRANLRPGAYVVTGRTTYRRHGRYYGRSSSRVTYPRGSSLSTSQASQLQRLQMQVQLLQKEKENAAWKQRASEARQQLEAERLAMRQRVQQQRVVPETQVIYQPQYICYFRSGRRKEIADYRDEGTSYALLYTNGGVSRYPKTLISRFLPVLPN